MPVGRSGNVNLVKNEDFFGKRGLPHGSLPIVFPIKLIDIFATIQIDTGSVLKGFRRFVGFPSRKNGLFPKHESNQA
jgi:hypothetical protein